MVGLKFRTIGPNKLSCFGDYEVDAIEREHVVKIFKGRFNAVNNLASFKNIHFLLR